MGDPITGAIKATASAAGKGAIEAGKAAATAGKKVGKAVADEQIQKLTGKSLKEFEASGNKMETLGTGLANRGISGGFTKTQAQEIQPMSQVGTQSNAPIQPMSKEPQQAQGLRFKTFEELFYGEQQR